MILKLIPVNFNRVSAMSRKWWELDTAVDMPLLGITLQVTPIRLENPSGFPHARQPLGRQRLFLS
jgi:hypothetical protein